MSTADALRLTKNEAIQVLRPQFLKVQLPVLELFGQESSYDQRISGHRRASEAAFRAQKSLIILRKVAQDGRIQSLRRRRNEFGGTQKLQQLTAGKYVAAPN